MPKREDNSLVRQGHHPPEIAWLGRSILFCLTEYEESHRQVDNCQANQNSRRCINAPSRESPPEPGRLAGSVKGETSVIVRHKASIQCNHLALAPKTLNRAKRNGLLQRRH